MGETKIEWTDKVWNPVTGCTKVSKGCTNCYAERMFHRPYPGRNFGDVRCHPERLEQPLRWRKPCRIFVNSMSDLFHENIPRDFILDIFRVMETAQRHTFQILTKRPQSMVVWVKHRSEVNPHRCPAPNVWLGVSVEDQETADERIPLLLQTPAAVRWVSYEPALEPLDFNERWFAHQRADGGHVVDAINWMVAGGESGPHARPAHPDWFRGVRDQCQAAGVPFFFKQWGEWRSAGMSSETERLYPSRHVFQDGQVMIRFGRRIAGRLLDGVEWNEFPADEGRGRNASVTRF